MMMPTDAMSGVLPKESLSSAAALAKAPIPPWELANTVMQAGVTITYVTARVATRGTWHNCAYHERRAPRG